MVVFSNIVPDRRRLQAALLRRLSAVRNVYFKGRLDFFQLLLAAEPSSLDILLLVVGFVAAVLGGMPFSLLGLFYGQLLDDMNSTCAEVDRVALYEAARQKVVFIFSMALANFTMIYTYMGCWSLFGERLTYRIRYAYLKALLKQEPAYFDTLSAGEIAARLDADTAAIQSGVGEKVGIYVTSISYFVTAYAVSFSQAASLTAKMSILVPLYFAWSTYSSKYMEKFTKLVDDGVNSATTIASECLNNITLIHAFGAAPRFEKLFSRRLEKARPAADNKILTSAIQLAFLYFIAYASNALAIWQGSQQIAESVNHPRGSGGVSFGKVYTVIICLLDASLVFTGVSPFLNVFSAARASYGNLVTVMYRKPRIDGTRKNDGIELAGGQSEFQLCDVTFRYPSRPETIVLDKVNITLARGCKTAIVGKSGSGKSTIAGLLNRMYDPLDGHVLLDGRNLREWNVESLRRSIAVVEQEPTLMDRSVFENVAFGLVGRMQSWPRWPRGSLEDMVKRVRAGEPWKTAAQGSLILGEVVKRVESALKQSGAYDYVTRLEHGMATRVGPKGLQLSGGQRQRIALARALVRDASVIVLDEATSALDTATESSIQQTLMTECAGCTIVIVAHRLSSIKDVDKIVVMSEGTVSEEGTYAELILKGGEFAKLVRLQSLHSRDDPSPPESPLNAGSASRLSGETAVLLDVDVEHAEESDHLPPIADANSLPQYSRVWSQLYDMIRPRRAYIVIGVATAVFIGISRSIEAIMLGGAIGEINNCHPVYSILANGRRFGFWFLVMGLLTFATNIATSWAFGRVSEYLLIRVRLLLLRSLLFQDASWHESEDRTPTSLLGYLSSDATSLSNITGNVLGISLGVVVSLIAGMVVSHIVAWKIAIVLVATLPLLVASGAFRMKVLSGFQEKHHVAFTSSIAIAREAIDAIRTVAAFGLEDEMLGSYQLALKQPYDATVQTVAYGNLWLTLSYSIPNAIYGVAYWWGTKQVLAQSYTPAEFFTVLPALSIGAQGCGQLFTLLTEISKATVAGGRVFDLVALLPGSKKRDLPTVEDETLTEKLSYDIEAQALDEKKAIFSTTVSLSSPVAGGISITLQNINFTYPSRAGSPILQDLSCSISAGSLCAFVGPSGSGKSTIFSLLERFYRPTSGRILIDGKDITRSDDTSFRSDIALVPQTHMIFGGSVAFNLTVGARPNDENVSRAEMEEACKMAGIHDVIEKLPQGYDTPGKDFSGGQKQRLSIARALIRKPRLLLLDEPTSALDAESESKWQAILETLRGKTTVVVIAHRLHTVKRADCIFVIETGRCVDRGRHEELMRDGRCESYRESVMGQMVD